MIFGRGVFWKLTSSSDGVRDGDEARQERRLAVSEMCILPLCKISTSMLISDNFSNLTGSL